jgi:tetratricopeptide (TPR) repeat protein
MKRFKLWNSIFGCLSFVFAAVVYAMTMEKSGSFWDCGEFLPSAFKLEIAHPPGFPLFLMLGRIFTLFTGADPTVVGGHGTSHVAAAANLMSALMASGTVMFTFWITTALTGRYVFKNAEYTTSRIIAVIGAGLIAAASCTFLDSQWFSAVEYIVFTSSQFFLSFNIWLILKWYADDSKDADRWLVLLAFITGVSIGSHLLALLGLPAIAVIIYYKKAKKTSVWGWLGAVAAGFFMIGLYMKYIISYTLSYFAGMDLFFVNTLGLPFNSGVVFGTLLIAVVIGAVLWYTHTGSKRDYTIAMGISIVYVIIGFIIDDTLAAKFIRLLFPIGLFFSEHYGYGVRRYFNIAVLSIAFSYIGYSSYLMVPIRATANPAVNMSSPTDPFTLKAYVDRDQYGTRPLLWGPDYTASPLAYVPGGELWIKDKKHGKYIQDGFKQDLKFSDDSKMFFPRLGFWQEERHKNAYRAWLNPEYTVVNRQDGQVVQTFSPNAQKEATDYANELNKTSGNHYYVKDNISWKDNIYFFLKYHVGFMYLRYFMWNFAGRQDDTQGTYYNNNGRWISGIPFIDAHLGGTPDYPQDHLPKTALENKARNKFYMIPLILGLIGLIFCFYKDQKTFWFLLVLFLTTGLGQIIFQNEPPIEPRERDYATACSFAVFTIWLGYGVMAIIDLLWTRLKQSGATVSLGVVLICASAPYLMGSQGWDDHNRSGRFTARDLAIDYLQSCAPNAILITQGDNDTYPLWYLQEIEGIRTDVRVINYELLGGDWYTDQLRYQVNESKAIKLTFTSEQLQGSNRDYIQYNENPSVSEDLKNVMRFMARDDDEAKVTYQGGEKRNYLPTKHFFLDVDTAKARKLNMLDPAELGQMVTRLDWKMGSNGLAKNDLVTLDIVANNFMDRPIYFSSTGGSEPYHGLEKYLQSDGLTYRVVPRVNQSGSAYTIPVRLDATYDNLMNKFRFGGIKENPNVYLDENILRMWSGIRASYARLAEALLNKAGQEEATGNLQAAKGDRDKAILVADRILTEFPSDRVQHASFDYIYAEVYYAAGRKEKARKLINELMGDARNELDYYKDVYAYLLNQAKESGDKNYQAQLEQGGMIEQHTEVNEQFRTMQQLAQMSQKYDEPAFAQKIAKDFQDYQMAFVKAMPQQRHAPGQGKTQ